MKRSMLLVTLLLSGGALIAVDEAGYIKQIAAATKSAARDQQLLDLAKTQAEAKAERERKAEEAKAERERKAEEAKAERERKAEDKKKANWEIISNAGCKGKYIDKDGNESPVPVELPKGTDVKVVCSGEMFSILTAKTGGNDSAGDMKALKIDEKTLTFAINKPDGKISVDTFVKVILPTKEQKMLGWMFIPTQGDKKNKKIYYVAIRQSEGTAPVIKFYRFIPTLINPSLTTASAWEEVGSVMGDAKAPLGQEFQQAQKDLDSVKNMVDPKGTLHIGTLELPLTPIQMTAEAKNFLKLKLDELKKAAKVS